MQRIFFFLLPALAATCFGAAIPKAQVLGDGTTVSVRPEPTFTFVVPCYGATDCIPKTLIDVGRDESTFTNPVFDIPSVSQSVNFDDGTTGTDDLRARGPEP
jgi:hypothetical protein